MTGVDIAWGVRDCAMEGRGCCENCAIKGCVILYPKAFEVCSVGEEDSQ